MSEDNNGKQRGGWLGHASTQLIGAAVAGAVAVASVMVTYAVPPKTSPDQIAQEQCEHVLDHHERLTELYLGSDLAREDWPADHDRAAEGAARCIEEAMEDIDND